MYVNTAIYEKGHCDSLTDWANVVENIVDLAVQADFPKHTGTVVFSKLPKRFRGRCQPRESKKCPTPSVVKRPGTANIIQLLIQFPSLSKEW